MSAQRLDTGRGLAFQDGGLASCSLCPGTEPAADGVTGCWQSDGGREGGFAGHGEGIQSALRIRGANRRQVEKIRKMLLLLTGTA